MQSFIKKTIYLTLSSFLILVSSFIFAKKVSAAFTCCAVLSGDTRNGTEVADPARCVTCNAAAGASCKTERFNGECSLGGNTCCPASNPIVVGSGGDGGSGTGPSIGCNGACTVGGYPPCSSGLSCVLVTGSGTRCRNPQNKLSTTCSAASTKLCGDICSSIADCKDKTLSCTKGTDGKSRCVLASEPNNLSCAACAGVVRSVAKPKLGDLVTYTANQLPSSVTTGKTVEYQGRCSITRSGVTVRDFNLEAIAIGSNVFKPVTIQETGVRYKCQFRHCLTQSGVQKCSDWK